METEEMTVSRAPRRARTSTPVRIIAGVSAVVFTLTGLVAGVRFAEIVGFHRESSALHARVDSLIREHDHLRARVDELEASPEMEQYREDLQKAKDFCDQKGLGELPVGLIEQAILAGDMAGRLEQEAQRLCPEKMTLLDLTNKVVDSARDGLDFSCTSSDSLMTISGTLQYGLLSGFPGGVSNSLLDFRIEGSSVRGEDTLNSETIDLTHVVAGVPQPFSIYVPITRGDPDQCSIRIDSWWPSGY